MSFSSSFRTRAFLAASALSILAPAVAHSAPNSKAMREALVADYPLTRVGLTGMAQFDYARITQPGAILSVRLPGIYADMANTQNVIVNTNYQNGQLTEATGFTAAFGGNTYSPLAGFPMPFRTAELARTSLTRRRLRRRVAKALLTKEGLK